MNGEFEAVFAELRAILAPYAPRLTVVHDTPAYYYLDAGWSEKWKRVVFFGAVAVKKSYVSFYLMPVYVEPALLDGMPDALRARMQGKSCFNFRQRDPALFAALAELTARGFASYEAAGLLPDAAPSP